MRVSKKGDWILLTADMAAHFRHCAMRRIKLPNGETHQAFWDRHKKLFFWSKRQRTVSLSDPGPVYVWRNKNA